MSDNPDFTPAPIRSRVWDGERMHDADDVASYVSCNGEWFEDWRDFEDGINIPGAIPLLSTGLRDADGREVFEGDLVEWEGLTVTVRRLWGNTYAEGVVDSVGKPATFDAIAAECRVVGNVFEGVPEAA